MTSVERRHAILEAATRLFRHYGHAKTTIADIAREAHVGVGTVYLEFPSKEAIIQELSTSMHDRVLESMRRVAQARMLDSFSERLAGVLEVRVATFLQVAREGQHACDLVHCKNEAVRSAHDRFRAGEHALFVQLLEEGRRAQEVGAYVDAARAAMLIQRAYASLSPPWLFDQPIEDAERAAYEMCRLLLLGLMTRDPGGPVRRGRSRAR